MTEALFFVAFAASMVYLSMWLDGWEARRDARRRNRR